MTNKQRRCAQLRLAGRALAGLCIASVLAFAVTFSAAGSPPDNDDWGNAITLATASGSTGATTVEATTESGEPGVAAPLAGAGVNTTQTVWWKWTAPSSDVYTFAATSSVALPTIGVFTGSSVRALTEVASDADSANALDSRVFFDAAAGTTYYVQVGSLPATTAGPVTLSWGANAVANDDFANAAALDGDEGSVTSWNVGATREPGEPVPPSIGDLQNTVWYSWTPSDDGRATLSINADFSRPAIAVYTGSTLASLHEEASDVGGPLTFDVVGGTTYSIQVGGNDTSPGTFSLRWALTLRPTNDDLANATDVDGGNVSESGTTIAATLEETEPHNVNGADGVQSVWYRWTPGASGAVTVSVHAIAEQQPVPLVQLYEGPATNPFFAALDPLGTHDAPFDDTTDTLHAVVDSTKTYYVQVMGDPSANVDFGFDLTAFFDNDLFANATAIGGASDSIQGTLAGATFPEASEPDPSGGLDHTRWYAWTAPTTGRATFQLDVSDFTATVAAYSGDALTDLVTLDHDEDAASLTIAFDATAGTTYHIQAGTYSDAVPGSYALSWNLDVPGPDNDDFADASALDGDSGSTEGGNTGATTEDGEPLPAPDGEAVPISETVWWKWVAPSTGHYSFDTVGSDFDTVLGIYTGASVDALSPVAADDDSGGNGTSRVAFDGTEGTTYYVQVGSYGDGGDPGSINLDWSLPPGNDDFESATSLEADSGSLDGTNAGATKQPGEPDQAGGDAAATVWYAWTPSADGAGTITLDPSFDSALAVYTGDSLETLTARGSDYDTSQPEATFGVHGGTTYYVQVASYFATPGTFALDWSLAPPQHYVVTTTADGVDDANCLVGSCTLRQAINAANLGGGDTIDVPAGSYQLSSDFGALSVDANMTIAGAGARTTTVAAAAGSRVFELSTSAAPVSISGLTMTGGTASEANGCFGGDLRNSGDVTLTEVTVTGGSACSGGGLSNAGGTMLVDRSTVSGNQALAGGGDSGGIQNFGGDGSGAVLTIRNSTITGNTARLGGGVLSWNNTSNSTVVENSTIAFNTATDRGIGGIGGDGSFSFRASIVAGNAFGNQPSNCSGSIESLGSNLESSEDCGFVGTGDRQNTDPQLQPPADNGGPTDTLALARTSPAVDGVGRVCGPETDQRGVERPQGESCDIGAFELDAGPPNDDWSRAASLESDNGSRDDGTTVASSLENGEPDPSGVLADSVWYAWTPSTDGLATVDLSAAFAGAVAAYTGDGLNALTSVDSSSGSDPGLSFRVDGGTTYYVQVGAVTDANDGTFALSWSLDPIPANDHLVDAAALSGAHGSVDATTRNATVDDGEPVQVNVAGSDRVGSHSVWYRWAPAIGGPTELTVAAHADNFSHQALIAMYRGPASDPSYDALQPVGKNDSRSAIAVGAVAGDTYYVQVMSDVMSETNPDFDFTLTWTTVPDAPALSAATPGNGKVTLDWDTPESDGGSPITGYRIYRGTSPDAETPLIDVPVGNEAVDSTAQNGTHYFYEVSALNVIGEGPLSTERSATPATVPGAPTLDSAAGGNGSVALAWTAPASDGGAAVTNYDVYRGTSAGAETLLTTVGNQTAYSDTTALNGTTYFYRVAAVNPAGEGASSNERSATPATAPGAPTLDSATGANGSVALAWTAPASNGGAAITGYGVYRGTTTGGETLLTTLGNVTSFTDSTAANGTTYFYEVSAVSPAGEGAQSNERSATPSTNPNAPTLDSATGGDGSVALAWTAPASGGAAITGYDVYRGTSAGGETLLTTLGNVTSFTDSTVANGTTYFYEVSAVNPRGESARSNERSATPATVPGAPTLDSATGGDANVALAWSAPASNGGAAITGYRVYRATSSGGETRLATLGNVTSFTDSTAGNKTTYFYEVTAVNGAGESAFSNERSSTPLNPAVRDVTGTVLASDGSPAAGIPVRACLAGACLDTTSDANGGYGFLDVSPGAYVVRALPTDPSLLAVQATADATQQSVHGFDLRLMTSGAGASDAGPSTFRVAGCTGGTLHYVATADGSALGSGDVADGAGGTPVDGVYTIDVSSLDPGHAAMLQLEITITCANATETQTAVLFADPSGTAVDDNAGGTALAGATVTLLDAAGNAIPPGDPRLSSATSANPETSDARGAWAWDVAPGTYRVSATKADCGTATSAPLTVTPTNPVSNVVLHLACPVATPPGFPPTTTPTPPTPPPATPPATLPDPVAGVNFNVIPISGTVLVNGAVLPSGQQIPFGADIDATNGIVSITTIGPDGKPQTAFFYGGEFVLTLDPDGVTSLVLKGGNFSVCSTVSARKTKVKGKKDTHKTKKRKTQSAAVAMATSKTVIRALWGTGKGHFRTKGRYSSATVRGTLWYHADRCDGTYTQVNQGVVAVLDFVRNKTLFVRAGHSVLVRPK